MKNRRLADELKLLVDRHGLKAVNLELQMLATDQKRVASAREPNRRAPTKARRRNGRINAPEYVAKMDIDLDKRPAVFALAERFEAKSFLPRCADISNFCNIYGIDEPTSKSRAAAIPRLFKYLATLDTKDVERLLADKAYSGPSQLGPLADAIRQHGRASRNLDARDAHVPAG